MPKYKFILWELSCLFESVGKKQIEKTETVNAKKTIGYDWMRKFFIFYFVF